METNEEVIERIKRTGKYSVDFDALNGLDYRQREILKHEASVVFHSDADMPTRARALLYWCEAHYWRARSSLGVMPKAFQRKVHGKNYFPGYELDIDVYTRHWLWSMGEKLATNDVLDYLADVFGYTPEKSKFLPKGYTEYGLPA